MTTETTDNSHNHNGKNNKHHKRNKTHQRQANNKQDRKQASKQTNKPTATTTTTTTTAAATTKIKQKITPATSGQQGLFAAKAAWLSSDGRHEAWHLRESARRRRRPHNCLLFVIVCWLLSVVYCLLLVIVCYLLSVVGYNNHAAAAASQVTSTML